MKKKGYKPALAESSAVKNTVDELVAHNELIPELLKRIDTDCSRHVTLAELKRDFGFTNSSLRLLGKYRLLVPTKSTTERPTYDLARALRIRVLLPGLTVAKNIRTRRKSANITTIYRDYLNRIIGA